MSLPATSLFILIPAAGSFGTAWNMYRRNGGKITAAVIGPAVGGLIITFVAGIFLFLFLVSRV